MDADQKNLPAETGSDGAPPRAEDRASAGDEGPQSGTEAIVKNGEEDPADRLERLWNELTIHQKKVAERYVFTTTKAEAARAVDLHPDTVYDWEAPVWEVSELLVDQRAQGIVHGLSALSPAALDALRRALDPNEDIDRETREAAEFVVNHAVGKPTQRQEVEHSTPGVDEDTVENAAEAVEDVAQDLFGDEEGE